MWESQTKNDLIIEVWEKLDCESVGTVEIEAIDEAVSARFGKSAVDSPMRIARLLADEGAVLRHSEIMDLWIKRASDRPYEAELRNIAKISTFAETLRTIGDFENLRRKFTKDGDKEGLRYVRDEALSAKKDALERVAGKKVNAAMRREQSEIAEWLTIWLQSPEIFENWIELRRDSKEFKDSFGGCSES